MSRRSCRQNICRLRSHRSYTSGELAEVLGVHVQTVHNWRKQGLPPIDELERPLLFLGSVVRAFLKGRIAHQKTKLHRNQMFCLKCQLGVVPDLQTVAVELVGRWLGNGVQAIRIRGVCPECGTRVVQLSSMKAIFLTSFWPKLQQGPKRLLGSPSTHLNTDEKAGN